MRYETKKITVIRAVIPFWHNKIVVIRYRTEIYTVIRD